MKIQKGDVIEICLVTLNSEGCMIRYVALGLEMAP